MPVCDVCGYIDPNSDVDTPCSRCGGLGHMVPEDRDPDGEDDG